MSDVRDTASVVRAYYDLLAGGLPAFSADQMMELLDPALAFEGPIAGSRVGAAGFARGVAGFVETASSLHLLQTVLSEHEAVTLYDTEMPGGPVRFAEFFHAEGGRIRSLRLLYDAHLYRAGRPLTALLGDVHGGTLGPGG